MEPSADAERILSLVDEAQVLELERAAIRIPSHSFEEHTVADYFAGRMAEIGLDVEMMDVRHPTEAGKTTRQPIGRLRGSRPGPTLMLNAHIDTVDVMSGWTVDPYGAVFEDGWIWGVGAHDDKGGVVVALAALSAIKRAGLTLAGDVLVCAVVAHKLGGIGTRALLERGIRADYCINLEHSTNTIATTCVGVVQIKITTRSPGLFFRFSAEAKAAYFNPIEQQALIVERLGPSIDTVCGSRWLKYAPHPDLPGFPVHRFDGIHQEGHAAQPERACELLLQVRTVPGQTVAQIRTDLIEALEQLKRQHPKLDYEVTIPAGGAGDPFVFEAAETPKDHPLVLALAEGQRLASARDPIVGGGLRLGNVGDGNITAAAGITSVQYGPGDIRLYPEWPAPNERVELSELVEASRAIAIATYQLCGDWRRDAGRSTS